MMPTSKFSYYMISIYVANISLAIPISSKIILGFVTLIFPLFTTMGIALFIFALFLRSDFDEFDLLLSNNWTKYTMRRYINLLSALMMLFISAFSVLIVIFVGNLAGISESDSIFLGLNLSMLIFSIDGVIQVVRHERNMKFKFLFLDRPSN